jgi:putative ABC transport system permease protein
VLAGLSAIPGVDRASLAASLPFTGDFNSSVIVAEGYVMKPGESLISPMQNAVSAGYFEAMGITLVRGRYIDARDTALSPRTVVVDERLAARFWPGQDPIGRRIYQPENPKDLLAVGPDTKFITIVGVVRNVQVADPGAGFTPVGAYYYPATQSADRGMFIALRTTRDLDSVVNDVRRAVAAVDPELAVYGSSTMAERMNDSLIGRRVPMLIALAFAVVALFLAAIGIYGVLAYGVAQRRREIGIRLALGSSAREVFGLVLGEGAKITAAGLVIGLAGAYFAGRAMASQLYEVKPTDPVVLAGVVIVLAVVALLATLIPARRAAKVNPTVALQ